MRALLYPSITAAAGFFIANLVFTTTVTAQDAEERRVEDAEWTQRAPLPERRTEVSATTDGRYIYLAGGFGPPDVEERLAAERDRGELPAERRPAEHDHGEERDFSHIATAPRTIWRYDPQEDEWQELTEAPMGVHHAPFQYHDGRLYILGGFRETTMSPVGHVWIYDLENEEWSNGRPMPTPRGASAWTIHNGRIHVIGGNAEGPEAVRGQEGIRITDDNSVNTHEAYDPDSDRWTRLAPMPTPRNHIGAAAANGRIHVVLGRADGDYTMTAHEIYDAENDSWTTGADVPTGRSGVAVLEHEGYIYAFGGERLDEQPRTYDDAERYDVENERWEKLPAMPTARHGLGAAVVDGAIFVISGGPGPAFTFGDANERLELDRE